MTKDKTERKIELITTDDGSHSLYVPELNETYHSFHGAVQESDHVFIKMGLDDFLNSHQNIPMINVLEVGLGTGLNALLTAQWAFEKKVKVNMTSIEAFPIDMELVKRLNYAQVLGTPNAEQWFESIHSGVWEEGLKINDWFELSKIEAKVEDYSLLDNHFDVVFFDAFAPNKQAELWEIGILGKVFKSQSPNGIFVTYCAKGQLKRDLKSLSYEVDTLQGPPGKKEMVRGKKV
ncbi:MAG: tRNA (5-methylaminomethyl-2-thiouridine)(34)-methyltransferase MnmD [Bacteroidota bacterium]